MAVDEPQRQLADTFAVGDWQIDGNALSASRAGESNALEPRAYAVLRYLAERPGKLVTIDELMDSLWRGAVVTPNAVTRIIAQLRKALDDDAKNPKYIETVARTGYRLVAETRQAKDSRRVPQKVIAAAALVAVLAIVATNLWHPEDDLTPAIAVLPFQNLTGEPAEEYLADGVAEEVLNALTALEPLDVAARSRSFRYRGSDVDLESVSRDLGVRYVTTGSVQSEGGQFRIAAQLVDTDSGNQVWSGSVDTSADDLFGGQDRLSRDVVNALAEELGLSQLAAMEALVTRRVPDAEAYDLYLRGRHVWQRRGSMDLQPAVDSFAEAVRIDPGFARAWAALASAYITYPTYSPKGWATWSLSENAAIKALELDPALAEPYGILATFSQARLEWALADSQYRRGIELAPRSATLAYWFGEYLAKSGRYVDGLEYFERAIELDPTLLPAQADYAFTFFTAGDFDRAEEYFLGAWNRGFRAHYCWMGILLTRLLKGDAVRYEEWIGEIPQNEATVDVLRRLGAVILDHAVDDELASDLVDNPDVDLHHSIRVILLSLIGRNDVVLDMLNTRLDNGWHVETRSLWAPVVDLRKDPKFVEILDRLRLVDYWEQEAWSDFCRLVDDKVVCDTRPEFPGRDEDTIPRP